MSEQRVMFSELAEMCQILNSLANRQFRPQLQLVKLYNCVVKISTVEEYFESEEQCVTFFNKFNFEYKTNHPYILKKLADILQMPAQKQNEELSRFAKRLDDHEQWEWESRRKSKSRRKAQYGRKTGRECRMSTSVSTNTLSSMSSMSSDGEPDDVYISLEEESKFRKDEEDVKDRSRHNLGVHCQAQSYYEWERERYESELYLQHQQRRLEIEQSFYPTGPSFAETNRHMKYYLDVYDYNYNDYELPHYANYQDFAESGLNLSKPTISHSRADFFDDERNLSPYIY